jgi:hypothetical protein
MVSAGPMGLCGFCSQAPDGCGNCVRLLLDRVPVLSSTVLSLEMLLDAIYVDIGAAAACVLSDVGASIQVLNWTSRDYDAGASLPKRIVECIAGLDLREFLSHLCGRTMMSRAEYAPVLAVWDRCQQVAQNAYIAAESIDGISPDDAYLAGLLDDRGAIADVLGWPGQGRKAVSAGHVLASEQLLPSSVLPAFESSGSHDMVWSLVLSGAHSLTGRSTHANADAIQ